MTKPKLAYRIILSAFIAAFLFVACNNNGEDKKDEKKDDTKMEQKADSSGMQKMDTGNTKPVKEGN